MALYYVTVAGGGQRRASAMIVSAADAADAKVIAGVQYIGNSGGWSNATATLLADVASSADDALVGWVFEVTILTPAGAVLEQVSATGTATDDTIDKIAALLVIAIDATDSVTASDYTGQLLTVAEIADGIGDHTLTVTVKPPVVNDASGQQQNQPAAIPGYIDTIVHEGVAAAVLTVEFPVDTYVRPTVLADFFTNG